MLAFMQSLLARLRSRTFHCALRSGTTLKVTPPCALWLGADVLALAPTLRCARRRATHRTTFRTFACSTIGLRAHHSTLRRPATGLAIVGIAAAEGLARGRQAERLADLIAHFLLASPVATRLAELLPTAIPTAIIAQTLHAVVRLIGRHFLQLSHILSEPNVVIVV